MRGLPRCLLRYDFVCIIEAVGEEIRSRRDGNVLRCLLPKLIVVRVKSMPRFFVQRNSSSNGRWKALAVDCPLHMHFVVLFFFCRSSCSHFRSSCSSVISELP